MIQVVPSLAPSCGTPVGNHGYGHLSDVEWPYFNNLGSQLNNVSMTNNSKIVMAN